MRLDFYGNSLKEIKRMLENKEDLTREKWDEYKTGKALYGSTSLMWIYAETSDWNKFLEIFKKREGIK